MLALWEFFWGNAGGSATATSTAIAVTGLSNAGGGGPMIVIDTPVEPSYESLEVFWKIREEYLERIHKKVEKELPHERVVEEISHISDRGDSGKVFAELVASRERAYRAAQEARTAEELEEQAKNIARLTLRLIEIKANWDNEIIMLLLLTE